MKNTVAVMCFILLSFPGLKYGAEPIPDDIKRRYPETFREYVKYSYSVSLPAGMRKALKAYNPTFKILRMEDFAEELRLRLPADSSNLSCYSALFQDLNGDERFDAAVLVEGDFGGGEQSGGEKYFPLLAVLSEGATSYRVIEITKYPGK